MPKLISKNKFAKSDYEIHSTYEAGISLLGWEVKNLRAQNVKLDNAFYSIIKIKNMAPDYLSIPERHIFNF
nr:SsrA-binding protein [Mycoplasmopsis arginini]